MKEFIEVESDGISEGAERFLKTNTKELRAIVEALMLAAEDSDLPAALKDLSSRAKKGRYRKALNLLRNINCF